MMEQIKSVASQIASFIWSLPWFLKYPIVTLLTVGVPGLTLLIGGAGISLSMAFSPLVIGLGVIWYLAKQA